MISLKNVTMAYTKDYNILQDVSLDVAAGERVLLFGEEGSGKTSLLRICLGLEKNFSGSCFIAGKPVPEVDFAREVSALYISSRGAFLEGKTCMKNIKYVLKRRGQDGYDSEIRIHSALKAYGIFSYKDIKAKKLNPFNRIMLQFARASFKPKIDIICVDDVFVNLTEAERKHMLKHLKALLDTTRAACLIAISNNKVAEDIEGRMVKIHLGSIEGDV